MGVNHERRMYETKDTVPSTHTSKKGKSKGDSCAAHSEINQLEEETKERKVLGERILCGRKSRDYLLSWYLGQGMGGGS